MLRLYISLQLKRTLKYNRKEEKMQKQKILIVDDVPKNLKKAREASKKISRRDYKFVFLSSAFEALSEIINAKEGDIRGVVTDLFFPREDGMSEGYKEYIQLYDSCDQRENPYKLRVQHNRNVLTESPFAAYGAVIALQCFKWGIPVTLVTTMHRHIHNIDEWIRHQRTTGPIGKEDPDWNADATLILSPLIEKKFFSLEDALNNYHPERYIATTWQPDKPWLAAIEMCLKQETRDYRTRIFAEEKARQDKEHQERLEIELELERRENLLSKEVCGFEITDDLRKQLLPYARKGMEFDNREIKIISPEVAFITTEYYGDTPANSKACCWNTIRCFYNNQNKLRKWMLLNQVDNCCAHTIRAFHLRITQIGKVEISTDPKDNERILIEVELINDEGNSRSEIFDFDKTEVFESGRLSDTKQQLIYEATKKRIDEYVHQLRGRLCSAYNIGRSEPKLIQQLIRPDMDVCIFVTREDAGYTNPCYVVYAIRNLCNPNEYWHESEIRKLIFMADDNPIGIENLSPNSAEIIHNSDRKKIEF
jgi:hypothetical protein